MDIGQIESSLYMIYVDSNKRFTSLCCRFKVVPAFCIIHYKTKYSLHCFIQLVVSLIYKLVFLDKKLKEIGTYDRSTDELVITDKIQWTGTKLYKLLVFVTQVVSAMSLTNV